MTERKRGGGVSPVDKLEVLMFADRHRREVNVDRCRENSGNITGIHRLHSERNSPHFICFNKNDF